MTNYIGKKVIVRGRDSGVYFGELVDMQGMTVELKGCRNIWSWYGANNLLDIAEKGVDTTKSRISVKVDSIVFTDICEIVPLTDEAIKNLEGASEWKF